MIEYCDTHCHIHSINQPTGDKQTVKLWSKLSGCDLASVVSEAKSRGVSRIICVGCDLEDSQLAIKAASQFDNVWATVGIHPHEAKHYVNDPSSLAELASLVNKNRVVAIGECGLDYFYAHSDPLAQKAVLEFQLRLATDHQLPVIFHVREAFNEFWPIFDTFKGIKGVLHSFTDSQANLERALKRGLYIGVNGIATFNKEPSQTDMYKQIPLEHLVLETDSPFLTPVPVRGTINEPKNVDLVARYLADLRGVSTETLASAATKNSRQLFDI